MDPVKKSGWTHRTATDAVVRYRTVKVQAWDAVAPTEFSTNRRLRTHIPDITHPTLYSTDAPFTMLGMGCPHPSFHNSYPVATHDIPNPPIVTEEGFAAAGYRQYDRIIPEDLWARLAELATVELNPSMLEEVDLQAPGEGGGRYQTTVSSVPHWLPDDLWQAILALLGFSLPALQGLEALCPKIIERWEAEPWKVFHIPHRDFDTVSETVSAVHGRVHPPHYLPPVQVPPGVPGHAGGLSRCSSVGYCYPTASQRDAPPWDGDPPRCGRAWPGTVHPVCTCRLSVAHADRGAGECNGADEQCSGDALRASGGGGCSRVSSGHRGQCELQPPPTRGLRRPRQPRPTPCLPTKRRTCRRRRRMRRRDRPRRLTRMPPPSPHRVRQRRPTLCLIPKRRRCRWRRRMRRRGRPRRLTRMLPPPPPTECGRGGLPHSRRDPPASLLRVAG